MIDRFGNALRVGWLEHEILWLEAAISLPFFQRQEAYREIAELTGRPETAVRYRAGQLKAAQERAKAVLVPARPAVWSAKRRAACLPTELRAPTKEQLMAGNGRRSRRVYPEAAE